MHIVIYTLFKNGFCDAMLSTIYAVVVCLSVSPSVCVYVFVCHTSLLYQNG